MVTVSLFSPLTASETEVGSSEQLVSSSDTMISRARSFTPLWGE